MYLGSQLRCISANSAPCSRNISRTWLSAVRSGERARGAPGGACAAAGSAVAVADIAPKAAQAALSGVYSPAQARKPVACAGCCRGRGADSQPGVGSCEVDQLECGRSRLQLQGKPCPACLHVLRNSAAVSAAVAALPQAHPELGRQARLSGNAAKNWCWCTISNARALASGTAQGLEQCLGFARRSQ